MARVTDQSKFWDRVEHELKVTQPVLCFMTTWMMRLGMLLVLLPAAYFMFFLILTPASGFFFSASERMIHPLLLVLCGLLFIILSAYLRFRAIGPITDKLKIHGLD